jgi:NADH:ubiquinone oxidoreductase subunit
MWNTLAMSAIELFTTRLFARKVGQDAFGNRYYESRRVEPVYNRRRRTVALAKGQDSSVVPPEWHAWLHHLTDEPLPPPTHAWQKPHQPNLTGTVGAWRPAGHDYAGGQRRVTGGDYEAWTPEASTPEASTPKASTRGP